MTRRTYHGTDINVTFDLDRCLHAAECVRGLPEVFDTHRKPWVLPDAAPAETVAEIVRRCPTGALEYGPGTELEGAAAERADQPTTIVSKAGEPMWVRGEIALTSDKGVEHVTRASLCRCGQTANAPFCDLAGDCSAWRS
ncbi:MAG: (4Fe-4S)-binding protein [Propionibacteriaceae bacterium]|jgi:uncharacterized Fe-S cluster protein YjdI|nr:(4Fe-4S)-binding protein [Propionibacteriaceae bacterium]